MRIIAIAGYHFSGCGVIDDLFREFDNVAQAASECESRYLQDMDGVSDLEFHLVEAPNRLTTNLAIDRFLRYCRSNAKRYEKIYGPDWMTMCEYYVDSLTKFQFQGYNMRHLNEKSPNYQRRYLLYRLLERIKPSKYRHSSRYNYFPKETMYHSSPTEQEFLEKTRAFVDSLSEHLKTNKNAEYVMIDQMFAGNNPGRYLKYVTDVKAFVVDRDPRDLYISQREKGDHMLPSEPREFCTYFRDIRKRSAKIPDNVMYLMIEDMIYHYDEMVPKVCDFVGIDRLHHIEPKKYFDPAISIRGTRTWERYPQYAEATKIIEQELPDFLYRNY